MSKDIGSKFKRFSKLGFLNSDSSSSNSSNNNLAKNGISVLNDSAESQNQSDMYASTVSVVREAEDELYLPTPSESINNYFEKTIKHKPSLSLDQRNSFSQPKSKMAEENSSRLEGSRPKSDFFPKGLATQDYQQLVHQATSPTYQAGFQGVGVTPPNYNINGESSLVSHIADLSIQPTPELGVESYLATEKLLTEADQLLLQHLIESSLHTTQNFNVLGLEAKDKLWKQHLDNQKAVQSLTTRLAIENKMRSSAQALINLHTKTNNRKLVKEAQTQLQQADKRVEFVAQELWNTYHKSWATHQTLLEHTAAVLALAYKDQERQSDQLRFQLQSLREGRMAEIDDSFIDNGTYTTKLRKHQIKAMAEKFNNDPDQSSDNLAVDTSTREDGGYQARLVEALAKVEVQEDVIEQLHQQHQSEQSQLIDKFESELRLANSRVEELQHQLNSHIQNQLKPISKSGIPDEAERVAQTQLESVLETLTQLYHQIPDEDPNEVELNGAQELEATFSLTKFVDRVDNLVEENHDLIDKVIHLQELVQQRQPNPSLNASDPTQSLKTQLAVQDLHIALNQLEKYLGKVKRSS